MPQKPFAKQSFEAALAEVRGIPRGYSSFDTTPTPSELNKVYSSGFQGARSGGVVSGPAKKAFPRLYDVFGWAKGLGKGKLSAPYAAVLQLDPDWGGDEAQTTGSCVDHATINGATPDYCLDALFGETEYKGRLAKGPGYKSRGYNSGGWFCDRAAYFVGPHGNGGLAYKKLYKDPDGSDEIDLRGSMKTIEKWAINGKSGLPNWFVKQLDDNKVRWPIRIESDEEYRDCSAAGFGISGCSPYGFSSTTDENGVAEQKGSWAHGMGHAGCDDRDWAHKKYGGFLGLDIQSWGLWNRQRGNVPDAPKQPKGSFWVRQKDIHKMWKYKMGFFGLCGVWGFGRALWEAFYFGDSHDMVKAMQDSTVQDYYEDRAKKNLDLSNYFLTA